MPSTPVGEALRPLAGVTMCTSFQEGTGCFTVPYAVGLTGCAGPSLEVATDPADAELFVDGRLTAAGEPLPFRYYGDILLHAEPPMEDGEFRHLGLRQTVSVSEPVTPWVFPLDFLAEVIMRPFTGAEDQSVTLGLSENPTRVLEGLEPAGAQGIRARSFRARADR